MLRLEIDPDGFVEIDTGCGMVRIHNAGGRSAHIGVEAPSSMDIVRDRVLAKRKAQRQPRFEDGQDALEATHLRD